MDSVDIVKNISYERQRYIDILKILYTELQSKIYNNDNDIVNITDEMLYDMYDFLTLGDGNQRDLQYLLKKVLGGEVATTTTTTGTAVVDTTTDVHQIIPNLKKFVELINSKNFDEIHKFIFDFKEHLSPNNKIKYKDIIDIFDYIDTHSSSPCLDTTQIEKVFNLIIQNYEEINYLDVKQKTISESDTELREQNADYIEMNEELKRENEKLNTIIHNNGMEKIKEKFIQLILHIRELDELPDPKSKMVLEKNLFDSEQLLTDARDIKTTLDRLYKHVGVPDYAHNSLDPMDSVKDIKKKLTNLVELVENLCQQNATICRSLLK